MRGLRFTFGLLTAQPQACTGLVLHGFFFFFFVLSVSWPRPPRGQMLVGTFNHENVTHIVFFIVCEIYFLLVLMKCLTRSKRMCHNMQGLCHW